MNRIDRLFAILLQLQRRSRLRGSDLAQQFGISKRTVYRDISALMEMGVPIISLPGEGYELEKGYFLPPLLFTPDEAQAVFLGTQMLREQAKGHLVDAAEQALIKVSQVLPPPTKHQVEQLTAVVKFYVQNRQFDLDDRRVLEILTAVQEQRVLWMRYFSYNRERWSEREIEPHNLMYSDGSWYVDGYCRLRDAHRSFRVQRISDLRLLSETFDPRVVTNNEREIIEVEIRFTEGSIRWVRERQHYGFVKETAVSQTDEIICTYAIHDLREIIPWLLSWGEDAEVLKPDELRQQLATKVKKLLEKLT